LTGRSRQRAIEEAERHQPIVAAELLFPDGSSSWGKDFITALPHGNWNKVRGLSQGANISVKPRCGLEIDGELVGLSEDLIRLKNGGIRRGYPQRAFVKTGPMSQGAMASEVMLQ